MNEPRTFQHSPVTQVFVVLLLIFMLGLVCFGFGFAFQAPVIAVPFGILIAFLIAFAVFSYTSRTIVSEEEIATRSLLGSKALRWTEIHRVSGRGYGIKLHNFDEDVTVAPAAQLPGYEEVIDWIGRKRPDLFGSQEYNEMKRGFGQIFGLLLALLVVVGVAVLFLWAEPGSPDITDTIVPIIFLGVVFLSIAGFLFSAPQSVTIEGGTLRLKYLLSEKTLLANEIASVNYSYTRTRNGKRYFIALNLADRKTLRVSGLNVSLPIAYLVLKNWHARNT